MELIDRIRKDIQERLDAVLGEAEKLRKALLALDPRGGAGARSSSGPRSDGASRQSAPTATRSRPASRPTSPQRRSTSRRRTPPGATKRRVLDALSDGKPKTAGEVAAATGVARGTVSTTLSKLAKSGEVLKAERGYRLPGTGAAPASSPSSGTA